MASHLFKHGALQTTNDNAIIIFQGRNVGGSPTINNGICIRMQGDPLNHPDAPNPLDLWRTMGAGLDEARFTQAYDTVQDYLNIRQIEPRSSRSNGPHLLRGWAEFAAAHDEPWAQRAPSGWFHKNFGPADSATPCAYCGYCNTGCPYGRKLGMAQTYLPDACANHGALILADTRVDRINWANGADGKRRAVGVTVTDEDGGERVINAKKGVVVAAGTIASSLLLDRSGIEGTGSNISMNIASPVIALMPEGMTPAWDEDQMATMVDCGDFLLESHFQPPLSMASLMPGWFGDVDRRMRFYDRICSAGVLFPADRRGHIVDGKLYFKLTGDELETLRRAAATLTRVHFAAGALEVWPALLRGQTLTPDMDIDAFYEDAIQQTDDVTVSSSHVHGGNPINADPALGVVDTHCRVHGTANVLVTDASVFPSCIRVNAQFSTMAIAQYATGFSDPFA
jgi:choline dehydrogenase-like flavoprotein